MAKKTKGKNSVESVAETLCNFSRFLCDIVISVYLFVILAVLPLQQGLCPDRNRQGEFFY